MMIDPKISLAGLWSPTQRTVATLTFHQAFKAADGAPAIAFASWAYDGWDNNIFYPTQALILKAGPDGAMRDATSSLLGNALTNGVGSIVKADFNSDGIDDLFLAAHNESPAVSKSSIFLLANKDGTFKRSEVSDSVQSHSALLGSFNGQLIVSTAGYGSNEPYYIYDAQSQTMKTLLWGNTYQGALFGSSSVVGDLDGDRKSEIVISDLKSGPGYDFNINKPWQIAIYHLDNGALGAAPAKLITPYFDAHKDQYPGQKGMGAGLDHVFRVRIDDFNYDGKPDIVSTNTIWTAEAPNPPSVIALLQNDGNLEFRDRTNAFMSFYNKNSTPPDYTMAMIDIDGSGIKSYLLGNESFLNSKNSQGNYLLLNDGTGHFYAALHDEFDRYAQRVKDYVTQSIPGATLMSDYPAFIGYVNGSVVDYVAEIGIRTNDLVSKALVNVPIHYNPTTDYTKNIAITDRNGSHLIRTFAGNDLIIEVNASQTTPTSINGGLGLDVASYVESKNSYTLSHINGSWHVKSSTIDDTLINVERLRFSDQVVALDQDGNAGQAYRLYKAALNRTPDEIGLAGWIKFMDEGGSLTAMGQQFIDSQEFRAKYGALDNRGFVNQLYVNVLARNGEQAGVDGWVNGIANGLSRADVLKGFSESSENQANVLGQIKDGISYKEWWLV